MKISSKGRYAVRVLIDIASANKNFISISEIADRQNISIKYLEKIMSMLAKHNLVKSQMGTLGGYTLATNASNIKISQILSATGDAPKLTPCQCTDSKCPHAKDCTTIGYWDSLQNMIYNYLDSVSLQDLIDKNY